MPGGETFLEGQSKTRPGVYVRTINQSPLTIPDTPRGTVAAVIRGDWGPLASPTLLEASSEAAKRFSDGGTHDVLEQAFAGGAEKVLAIRAGTGGTKAAYTLLATATPKVVLTSKYFGTRATSFKVTKRVDPNDATKNQVLLYEGTTLLEQITYTPGGDDATALAAAVNELSEYVDASVSATGAVDAVTQASFTGGSDPTVDGAAYTTALGLLETEAFDVLAVDTEDTTIHAAVAAWLDRVRGEGLRAMAVIGEPTSVAEATRRTNAAAFNRAALVYVGNGFVVNGESLDGYQAAAWVAGAIAGASLTESLTHKVVAGASDLVGALTGAGIVSAINAGMLVFTKNAQRNVQVEYGITTLVTPGENEDDGWKKIRRVRTRDALINDVVDATDPLIGQVNNDATGRAQLRAAMQGRVNRLIGEGALVSGTVREDPGNPAAGDEAYFVIEVDDNDSAEKVYVTFGFRFTAAA